MDGQSGGDGSRGGASWRGSRTYDATNQIKQLLGVPTEDMGKPIIDADRPTPPLNIQRNRQGQILHEHNDRSGSPSSRQQWDNHRSQDGRHRSDSYGSPGRSNPRHNSHDPYRQPPNRYYDTRRQSDAYGSPGRSNHRQGSYERIYSNSPRNHHPYVHQYRGTPKDMKDMRMNGPRHLGSGQIGMGQEESPDFKPSPEVLTELQEQFLFPLKKKSIRFPKAKYFCRLCDYHCDSLVVCRRHIADARHRKLKDAKDLETTLKNVPTPVDAQAAAVEKLITKIVDDVRVTPGMMEQRKEVVKELNALLALKVEGCRLEMVGSSVSGFCLRTSDINIDVVMDENLNASIALLAVRELVRKSDLYIDVLDDLTSSFPTMAFTHAKTGLRMVVGAGSTSAKHTNQLLADYASIDPRVLTLGLAFRYWAKLCQMDDQSRGTLPPHVFPLMVVHFLQQHNPPVLPVLHSLHPNPDGDSYLHPSNLGDKWQCQNTQIVGRLWLDMFRFYTIGFKMTDLVINVRQKKAMPRAEKTWNKKITVEDPYLQKRNLTRTVSGNPVFEYIVERFKTSYRYFAIPQLEFGPLFTHIVIKEAGQSLSEGSSECENERTEDDMDVTIEGDDDEDDEDTGNTSGVEVDIGQLNIEDSEDEPLSSISTNGVAPQDEPPLILEDLSAPVPVITPTQAIKLTAQIQESQIILKFEEKFFTAGQKPPLICGSCQKEGHCKAECREDELPPLTRLPVMNNHFLNQLTAIFEQLTKDFEPTAEEIDERDKIVQDLENYIRQFFNGVQLKLFGSSANGFGFQRSDLDICLTFKGNPEGKDLDHIHVIEAMADKLKRYRQCNHVFAITTAKVPIVKFGIRRACLEGDLSLYNTLALQNTKLLATYASIDRRVKCLGYAMKYFAKLCDIGDASRGSLSSYAYILMVLHFLQQVKPPVIPVLQELYDHSKPAPQLMIDGWNAWFFQESKGNTLEKEWKEYGKNRDSVGRLWVSMLQYYTETFNWKEHVVTIRQLAPLTRLQKLWNSRCIAIEDPFDLSHNLGAGLSRKMNTFIMKAFIRGREIFGTPISTAPPGYRDLVDYLFDAKHFTDGAPPNDRGCRFCGKIGHVQKDCPKKKLTMEKREKKERQKGRREMHKVKEEEKETGNQQQTVGNQPPQNSRDAEEQGKLEAVVGSGEGPHVTPKASKGNCKFSVPASMMEDHCKKWESDIHYRKIGEIILGFKSHQIARTDIEKFGPDRVVCACDPPLPNSEVVWTFGLKKATKKRFSSSVTLNNSCVMYRYILEILEDYISEGLLPDVDSSPDVQDKDKDISHNIGERLYNKMREAVKERKLKRKEKMKLRHKNQVRKANQKGHKSDVVKLSNIPTDNVYECPGNQVEESLNSEKNPDRVGYRKKKPHCKKSKVKASAEISSSDEEDLGKQRVVRRKVRARRPKNEPRDGKEISEQSSLRAKEGAIKSKHQPPRDHPQRVVNIAPDKEIITITTVFNRPKKSGCPKEGDGGMKIP